MKNLRNQSLGLLEKTLLEFKQRGNISIEEIREYLRNKYQLTVSYAVLQKRLEAFSV